MELLDYLKPNGADQEHWVPEDDGAADWCLRKIRENESQIAKNELDAKAEVERIQRWLEAVNAPMKKDKEHFENVLREYAEQALEGKKKRSMTLPNGKFGFRKVPPKIKQNDEALLEYAKTSAPDYVKVKESVDWAGLKKSCKQDGDHYVTPDGEILPGVTVTEQGPKFYVDTKGDEK